MNQTYSAEKQADLVDKMNSLLQSLIRDGESKFSEEPIDDNSPTLATAIAKRKERQAEKREVTISDATAKAKEAAIISEARNRADEILAEAKRQAEETKIAIQEGFNELQRQKEEWQATQVRLDAEAKSEATALERDARRTELISRAKDPKVQTLLRPFLDDGLWQPGRGNSTEFGPISLGALRKVGALTQNQNGLRRLVQCASANGDRYRTRWAARHWRRNHELIEKYKEAQQLLIELGPTMVDIGMLAP